MGDNRRGQCSPPATTMPVTALSSGWDFGLALAADGRLLTWGRSDYGQLGRDPVDADGNVPGVFVQVGLHAGHPPPQFSIRA